jgi:hypothetical protein
MHRKLRIVGASSAASGNVASDDTAVPNSLRLAKLNRNPFEEQLDPVELVQFPQCVPATKTDMDAFCEDKLNELVLNAGDANLSPDYSMTPAEELRTHYASKLQVAETINGTLKDPVLLAGDSVLAAVRQCNPFNAMRKQVLDCVVVERTCDPQLSQLNLEGIKMAWWFTFYW